MPTSRTDRARRPTREASQAGQARDAILVAARQEFSAKGPAGARVNEIAARSGVNKQLIYYYFGNKEGLYAAALEAVYGEIRELEQDLLLDEELPEVAMRALVEFSFDYLAAHPEFIGMLKHENASGALQIQQSETIRGLNSPLIASIRKTLKRGVATGAFREGIDPLNLYISIAGMSYFFFSNRLTLSSIFGRDLANTRSVAAYRRHVIDYALAGLQAG
jgi:TetR/AcrR family transcriptional regulator